MKSKEKWLDSEQWHDTGDKEILELIDRIQQDAQPKWVTGEEAAKWPDGVLIVIDRKNELPLVWRKSDQMFFQKEARFLRLDDLLNQKRPNDSQADINPKPKGRV